MTAVHDSDYITDILAFGTALTTVVAASYSVPSNLIDNTYAGGKNRIYATLVLTFSAPLAAGTGTPFVTLFPLLLPDGVTYPTPPGNAASAPSPNSYQLVRQVVPSTNYSSLTFRNIELEPGSYAFMFYNNTGVDWTCSSITATLYRYTLQVS